MTLNQPSGILWLQKQITHRKEDKILTNTEELIKAIKESGLKRVSIAESLGITAYSLQKKIKNEVEFKASEVQKITSILGFDNDKMMRIFFDN